MLNRYTLIHIILIDDQTVKAIHSTGHFFYSGAIKKRDELIGEIIGKGNENLYFTNFQRHTDGSAKVDVHDVSHYFEIVRI